MVYLIFVLEADRRKKPLGANGSSYKAHPRAIQGKILEKSE